ncbi:MAG: DMT family transporter [Aromatoleum sp.]|nr:DMT family transporter [Aromatoleum sp.]
MRHGVIYALAAAALFGASTPLAKSLVGDMHPLVLAGLLYAGSGCGLVFVLGLRRLRAGAGFTVAWPTRRDLGWLGGAILTGGVAGPVLLMFGLTSTPAATASLLLNLEAVLTALIAWFVFRENFDRRIALGMALIVAGGVVLSWAPASAALVRGALFVAAACLCWALDNNLTRKVAANDAVVIAGLKGLVAGGVTLSLALGLGYSLPATGRIAAAAAVGFLGYGVSLVLFVLALRHLGTARTGAYFSVAPFFGAVLAVWIQHEAVTLELAAAGALMAIGVWLHLAERHEHEHAHERAAHAHMHRHDVHHRHDHDFTWDGSEPHAHPHVHASMRHRHAHFPDIDHRHSH